MAKSKLVAANEKIANAVVGGYKKIEQTVVGGYKKVEQTAVSGYERIETGFVERYLAHEDESVSEAKARLSDEQKKRHAVSEQNLKNIIESE